MAARQVPQDELARVVANRRHDGALFDPAARGQPATATEATVSGHMGI